MSAECCNVMDSTVMSSEVEPSGLVVFLCTTDNELLLFPQIFITVVCVCVYIFTLKTQQAIYNPSQRLERVSPDALKFNLGDLTAILSLCTYQYVDCPKGEGIMEL